MKGSATLFLLVLPASTLAAQGAPPGKPVYDRWCSGCHGDGGAGDGPAATTMLPRPRDFTKGVYRIRTTESGELPTDADIRHVIEVGMPGTAMPEWRSRLSDAEIDAVVAYLKSFSTFFAAGAPKAVEIGNEPGTDIDDGRATFVKLECAKCHGPAGRGSGPSAPTLKDDYGHPIRAADLTQSWKFRGGNTVRDIYTRLRTGLDGTPMPSFSDAIENGLITDDQLWHVAQYVRSLAPERAPEPQEVVRASLVDVAPTSPDTSAWRAVPRFWVPLVGQIIAKPRWFAPTVDGVWVQAAHDGRRLSIRLAWDDPSRSPDAAWDEWLEHVSRTMTTADGPNATRQGPDRMVVEFPAAIADDAELPYFLGGSSRRPVYAWRWASAPDAVEEGRQTAIGQFAATGSGNVRHAARFVDGEWQLVLTRALAPGDTLRAPRFTPGRPIPIAFFAADGSNGEDAVRGAVSAWYAIYLDVPTPARVFVAPIVTIALSAGLGMLMVVRAQRRQSPDSHHPEAP